MQTYAFPRSSLLLPAAARMGRFAKIMVAIGALALLAPPQVDAKTLRDKETKFKIKAPAGFKLKAKKGIYTISKGKEKVTLMRVYSALDAKGTAKSFVKTAKVKKARIKKTGSRFVVTGLLRNKEILVEFRKKGRYYDVASYQTGKSKGSNSAAASGFEPTSFVTLADVARLRAIANSRQGGILTPLQVAVPMRRFTEGGATALVPNVSGWVYHGVGGAIDGSRPDHGNFALGIGVPILFYVPSGDAITQLFPPFTNGTVQVTAVQKIPNSDGALGPSFDSAFYAIRFVSGGATYQGIMLSGTNNSLWYFSYVATLVGGPTGIGPALLDTWRTWDPSVAANARLNQTIRTILSTPSAGPIDPDVFDRANDAWLEYIRQ